MTAQASTDVNGALDNEVHHPKHYNSHPCGIECAEYSELLPGNLSHVCVYVWRYEDKGRPIQDLEKALWFLDRERNRTDSECAEAKAMLRDPVPAVRIEERLRPLRRFVGMGDFVAVVVELLLSYELDEAAQFIAERLAELKGTAT